MSHPADPPAPLPDHLQPDVGMVVGPGDLRIAPSTEELRMIASILAHEGLAGQTMVTMRDGSPWLELDVVVAHHVTAVDGMVAIGESIGSQCPHCDYTASSLHDEIAHMQAEHPEIIARRLEAIGEEPKLPARPGLYRYAIWRYTCAAYRVIDGAVEDDPFLRPAR